jgi:hypothetical protein
MWPSVAAAAVDYLRLFRRFDSRELDFRRKDPDFRLFASAPITKMSNSSKSFCKKWHSECLHELTRFVGV